MTINQVVSPYRRLDPFFGAMRAKFGVSDFAWDLAAGYERARAPQCFRMCDRPLEQNWSRLGGGTKARPANLWLDLESRDGIDRWAQKCVATTKEGAGKVRIFLLTTAIIGVPWFERWVNGNARVFALTGWLHSLDPSLPHTSHMLSVFDGVSTGIEVWDWRREVVQ